MEVDYSQPKMWVEAAIAVGAFLVMCLAVLSIAPKPAEPDDGAYHASVVAVADGHLWTLSLTQAEALAARLRDNPAAPPGQWAEVAPGHYYSEKNPGYPFLAAPFQRVGLIRVTPMFFGALACVGLFAGARRWFGAWGGAATVGLYCSSGAALAFAWRDYMPTFTDASLVAAGVGFLLWALLAIDPGGRRRISVGLGGFVALEAATFARYTNVVILFVAVVVVLLAGRLRTGTVPPKALWWWLGSVVAFGGLVALFDTAAYGGPLTTGYGPGEVTFSVGAVRANLHLVPGDLVRAMPMVVFAGVSLVWIVARFAATRGRAEATPAARGTDLAVGLALTAAWVASWGLYATYTWTTDPTNAAISDIRFYLPALGPIALLGAWLVTQIPGRLFRRADLIIVAATAVLFVQGVHEFHAMYTAFDVPMHHLM